jgi:hypothetical protein
MTYLFYLLLLILITASHGYFFYSLWLLWKKGANRLSWYHGLFFAGSAKFVVDFWIRLIFLI